MLLHLSIYRLTINSKGYKKTFKQAIGKSKIDETSFIGRVGVVNTQLGEHAGGVCLVRGYKCMSQAGCDLAQKAHCSRIVLPMFTLAGAV